MYINLKKFKENRKITNNVAQLLRMSITQQKNKKNILKKCLQFSLFHTRKCQSWLYKQGNFDPSITVWAKCPTLCGKRCRLKITKTHPPPRTQNFMGKFAPKRFYKYSHWNKMLHTMYNIPAPSGNTWTTYIHFTYTLLLMFSNFSNFYFRFFKIFLFLFTNEKQNHI